MSESKSLLAIANEVNSLETMLLESQGEITEEIEKFLSVKETHLPDKVDSYYFIMEGMKSKEALYKAQADRYAVAAKSFKNAQETLKERLKLAMAEMSLDEIKGHAWRFKLSASKPSLVIEDQSLIPDAYFVLETTRVLEKDRLLEDLKIGQVAGAKLEPSSSLRSYVMTPKVAKKGAKDE